MFVLNCDGLNSAVIILFTSVWKIFSQTWLSSDQTLSELGVSRVLTYLLLVDKIMIIGRHAELTSDAFQEIGGGHTKNSQLTFERSIFA